WCRVRCLSSVAAMKPLLPVDSLANALHLGGELRDARARLAELRRGPSECLRSAVERLLRAARGTNLGHGHAEHLPARTVARDGDAAGQTGERRAACDQGSLRLRDGLRDR